MFDLDAAVGAWRARFARDRAFSATDLDELEDHLRAAYEVELLLDPGRVPEEAFEQARAVLGGSEDLAGEFAKVGGRAWRWLLRAGWAIFTLSWFLPVHRYGGTLMDLDLKSGLLPGVQALLTALEGGGGPLGVASAFTNLVMAATLWRLPDAGRRRLATLAGLLGASVALNLWWLASADQPSELLAGYWAWTASFGVAGGALTLRARALPEPSSGNLIAAP